MACLVRRLDGIKRLKAKQPDQINNFTSQELRDYQRESYQFRIKLGRLRQLRLNNGQLGVGHAGVSEAIQYKLSFLSISFLKFTLKYISFIC